MPLMPSWLAAANDPACPFPLNNLPYGVFSDGAAPRCGVAIGDSVLDLAACAAAGLIPGAGFDAPALNPFMEAGPQVWAEVRARLQALLAEGATEAEQLRPMLHPLSAVTLHLPFTVTEYTDFYAGRQHAFNVGSLFRGPENALPPNWLHIPIGYNGRASTVVVSGTDVIRPNGQTKAPDAAAPSFGPCKRLDLELEFGAVVGRASAMGQPVTPDTAAGMIFGFVLLNDWSARDIQAWEYVPLGPFQAKAFATTISPWVVTPAALEPFRTAPPEREKPLLPYLAETRSMTYDIDLTVTLTPAGGAPLQISRSNTRHLYYSPAQQLAHHSSSGCAMRVGDLLGSGTISGPEPGTYGSLLEVTWGGRDPVQLPDGGSRVFLEDGDTLALAGAAQGDGYTIGFGPCEGRILPAPKWPA